MNMFNMSEEEMGNIERKEPEGDSRNEQAESEKYEDFGPPSKIKINMIRTSINSDAKEKHITLLISDIIADNGKPQSAAADSATQASVLAMEHRNRCFLERP